MKTNRKEFFDNLNKISKTNETSKSYDEFSKDAIDGWSSVGFDEMLMKKLDKKMVPKFTLVYPTTVLVAIGITTTLVFNSSIIRHSNQKSTGKTTSSLITKRTNSNEENENKLDNRKTQIQSINKQEKNSVVEIYEEKAKEEISFSFQSLPILHFDKFEFKNKDRVNLAKETYLNDYKVVDYRFYRKRPLEEQKNELLTGVPASFETNENLKTNDELEIEKSYFNFLEKSLKLLKEEKYNFAEERFELILKTYELDVNALFYLAITKYKLKEYRSCLEMLDKLENARFTNFNDDADWFRLNCYFELRDDIKFEDLKNKMLNENHPYSKMIQKIEY